VRWWLTEDRGWRRKKGCGGCGLVSSSTSARCRPRTCSSPSGPGEMLLLTRWDTAPHQLHL
jgi:hypothetical protein